MSERREELFSKTEAMEGEKEGKNIREIVLRTIAIRKSLQWCKTTVGAKQSEMVVQEGGLMKDMWYLQTLMAASKEYLSHSQMTVEDEGRKWQARNRELHTSRKSKDDARPRSIPRLHCSRSVGHQ